MSEKGPLQKMKLKSGMRAALLHVPEQLADKLGDREDAVSAQDPTEADFILDFAATQAEAEARLRAWASSVDDRTVAWMAYPKGSKAAGHDVNRDTLWRFAGTLGLVLVANVAVDDTWSAVRLRPGPLDVEQPVRPVIPPVREFECHVVDRDAADGPAIGLSMMGVSVYHEVGAVPIDDLGQSRGAEEREDLRIFAEERFGDGRVVNHHHPLLRPHLGQGAL